MFPQRDRDGSPEEVRLTPTQRDALVKVVTAPFVTVKILPASELVQDITERFANIAAQLNELQIASDGKEIVLTDEQKQKLSTSIAEIQLESSPENKLHAQLLSDLTSRLRGIATFINDPYRHAIEKRDEQLKKQAWVVSCYDPYARHDEETRGKFESIATYFHEFSDHISFLQRIGVSEPVKFLDRYYKPHLEHELTLRRLLLEPGTLEHRKRQARLEGHSDFSIDTWKESHKRNLTHTLGRMANYLEFSGPENTDKLAQAIDLRAEQLKVVPIQYAHEHLPRDKIMDLHRTETSTINAALLNYAEATSEFIAKTRSPYLSRPSPSQHQEDLQRRCWQNLEPILKHFASATETVDRRRFATILLSLEEQKPHIPILAEKFRLRNYSAGLSLELEEISNSRRESRIQNHKERLGKAPYKVFVWNDQREVWDYAITDAKQYEEIVAQLIEDHVEYPDEFVALVYLDGVNKNIKSYERIFGRFLHNEEAEPPQYTIKEVQFALVLLYQRQAEFFEARAASTVLQDEQFEDLQSAFKARLKQLEHAKSLRMTNLNVGEVLLDPQKEYPNELKELALELGVGIARYINDRSIWSIENDRKFNVVNAARRLSRRSLEAISYITSQGEHIEPAFESRIQEARQLLFEARSYLGAKDAAKLKGVELSRGSMTVACDMTMLILNPDIDYAILTVKPDQAQLLGRHIRAGLELLRDKKYIEAVRHFEDEKILEECSFQFVPGNFFRLRDLHPNTIANTITDIAQRSWFYSDGRVSPSYGILPEGYDINEVIPPIQPEMSELEKQEIKGKLYDREQAQNFLREVALIYAEEWTHAYQRALGRLVSKKGMLLSGTEAHEHDIAEYFRENGVEMSELFLSRYGRDDALKRLKGTQTEAELNKIASALRGLDSGKSCDLSLTGKLVNPSEAKLRIEKLANGLYKLTALDHKTPIFVPDSFGIWRRVKVSFELAPLERVRIGPNFEVRLP